MTFDPRSVLWCDVLKSLLGHVSLLCLSVCLSIPVQELWKDSKEECLPPFVNRIENHDQPAVKNCPFFSHFSTTCTMNPKMYNMLHLLLFCILKYS